MQIETKICSALIGFIGKVKKTNKNCPPRDSAVFFMKFIKFCCCDYSAVTAEPSCSPLIVISLMAEFQASKDSASYSCAVNIVSISPE